MGGSLKEKRTTGAAAFPASAPRMRATFSSSSSSEMTSSAAAASPSACSQVVREVKQLWERCAAAATPEKLLLAAERLFERLSSVLEQHGLTYPAEVVQQDVSAAAMAGAESLTGGHLSEQQQQQQESECLSGGSSTTGETRSWGGSAAPLAEEEKFCRWLQAAAKQFLLLLCELLDADAEELQQGGLSFCMRIVAHTHRVQAAAALRTSSYTATAGAAISSSSRAGFPGSAASTTGTSPGAVSSPPCLVFPLSTYQLLLSRVLQARNFSAALANALVQQFLLPHPDLRFYFLLIARKILEGQQQLVLLSQKEQQEKKTQRSASQQQPKQQQRNEQMSQRQWYHWPAAVGPEAAAQRLYRVLAAMPLPQKSNERKRSSSSRSGNMQGGKGNSSSSDSEGESADSLSVSGSDSSSDGEGSTSADDSGDESSSGSQSDSCSSSEEGAEGDGDGQQQRKKISGQKKKKKRWTTPRLQDGQANTSYAVKSCYLLKVNTRRCCDPSEYRRLLERVWLLFLRCSASVWSVAKLQGKSLLHHLLLSLPRLLLPYMSNPLLLADFFLEAFDAREAAVRPEDLSGSLDNRKAPTSSSNSSSSADFSVPQRGGAPSMADGAAVMPQSSSFSSASSSASASPSSEGSESVALASTLSGPALSTAFSEEAVLALSGLFYLVTQHRLGDPDALWEGDGRRQQQQQESASGESEDPGCSTSSDGETGAAESSSEDNATDAAESSSAAGGRKRREGHAQQAAATVVGETHAHSAAAVAAAEVGGGGRETADDDPAAAGTAAAGTAAAGTGAAGTVVAGAAGAAAGATHAAGGGGNARRSNNDARKRKTAATRAAGGVRAHFYGRLYELLTPAAFSAVEGKARRRFLRLLALALRSPLLPTHLVASFLKKCCRVACLVSPGGAVYLAGLVFVLLRKYAAVCSALIDVPLALAQELVVQGGDPFDYNRLSLQQQDDHHRDARHEKQEWDSGRAREEEARETKRLKYTSLAKELAVAGDAAGGGERRSSESLASCEKQMKNEAGEAGSSESGEHRKEEQQNKSYDGGKAGAAGGNTAADDATSRRDLADFADTQAQKLYELVLMCAPGKNEQHAREGIAGVTQGSLLATKCVKQQAQTALWELELLRVHYDPAVRQFVSLFDVAFGSSTATGKRARAAAAMAATLDPDDYYWRLDWGTLLQHDCRVAAKKSVTAAPPVANRANLPPPDVMQLANAAVA